MIRCRLISPNCISPILISPNRSPVGFTAEPQPKSNLEHYSLKIRPVELTHDFPENQLTKFSATDITRTNKGGVTNLHVGTQLIILYPTFCPVVPGTLLRVKADPPRQVLVGRSSSCSGGLNPPLQIEHCYRQVDNDLDNHVGLHADFC